MSADAAQAAAEVAAAAPAATARSSASASMSNAMTGGGMRANAGGVATLTEQSDISGGEGGR